jgi:DNA-binding NarL/FixJ family response regulator
VAISVLLVDEHRLVREALRDRLAREPDIEVVGEASDASTACERVSDLSPEVVVLDIGFSELRRIETARRLKRLNGAAPKIVALATHADSHLVGEMLRAGAAAYVTKSSASTELVQAIRAAAAGRSYLCPEVAEALLATMHSKRAGGEAPSLSRREREVLRMIAEGMRSAAIASRLDITVGTVEVHRRNIMDKLGVRTVAELTRYAVRERLVAP